MKDSQKYQIAMMAVLMSNDVAPNDKLEIIEMLMDKKSLAEWSEKCEEAL